VSYVPTYSHGGASVPGWPAVIGNVAGAGRPVSLLGANASSPIQPCMNIILAGIGAAPPTCTVILECNGGKPDTNGNPPSTDWIDVSGGGYNLSGASVLAKLIPAVVPFWRTRIVSIFEGNLVSYVPLIPTPTGVLVSPSYPNLMAAQSLF
jgi:hypothetical protein